MKWLLLTLLCPALALGYTANDGAKTMAFNAASLSDTQGAVDYVDAKNEAGWVLTASSAATGTWTDDLDVFIGHAATIDFAGSTITSAYNGSQAINWAVSDGVLVTIKNLIAPEFSADCFFRISGSGVNTYRITNVIWPAHASGDKCVEVGNAGGSGTITTGADGPYGLIDQCSINGGGAGFYFYGVGENWERPMTWGTTSVHCVEDCIFTAPDDAFLPAVDGWNGCRYLARNNELTNYFLADHGADTAGLLNAALQHEIYDNVFLASFGYDRFIFIRGGTARVRGNIYGVIGVGFLNQACKTAYFRADGTSNPPTAVDRTYPADYVGTMQVGSGATPGTTGSDPNYPSRNWGSVPMHYWGNTLNCATGYGEITTSNSFVNIGRDIILSAPVGHSELAYPHPLRTVGVPTVSCLNVRQSAIIGRRR